MNTFTTLELSDGRRASIKEASAEDVFAACCSANGNMGAMPTYLLMQITEIEGKKIELDDLPGITAADYMAIIEVINVLITPTTKFNP